MYLERFVRSQIIGKFDIELLLCLIAAEVVQSLTVSTYVCIHVYLYVHIHHILCMYMYMYI